MRRDGGDVSQVAEKFFLRAKVRSEACWRVSRAARMKPAARVAIIIESTTIHRRRALSASFLIPITRNAMREEMPARALPETKAIRASCGNNIERASEV